MNHPLVFVVPPGPGDYSIEETAFWSERVYTHVFRLLNEYNVVCRGCSNCQVYFLAQCAAMDNL